MNVQRSLIWEFHEFEVGHKAAEATKNIPCAKAEGVHDYSPVTKCLKKFCSDYRILNNQVRLG